MISRSDLTAEVRSLMTPQERAEKILNDSLALSHQTNEELVEMIRVTIVEATNDELEKRRAAEAQAARLAEALRDCIALGKHVDKNKSAKWAYHEIALASTDSRVWLDEQIAAELLRCADELQDPSKFESREVQYLRKRAAALLQQVEEGRCSER